jgi:hypothetical protein
MKKIAIMCILLAGILTGVFQSTFMQPEGLENNVETKSYTMPAVDLYPHVVDLVPF